MLCFKKSINIFLTLENEVTAEPGDPALGKVGGGGEGEVKRSVAILTRLRGHRRHWGSLQGQVEGATKKAGHMGGVPRQPGTECPGGNGLRAAFSGAKYASAG